jgi:hypothetical protein
MLANAGSLKAVPINRPHQIFEKMIQRKATIGDVKELNRLIDQKENSISRVEDR